ncbi:hypothetical protein PP175_29340 (plasmid) [Aneurinibacillus sp. Ricciae_BoGa-3]|uniref:hypothetical protein n=1 Tax=Aneurinibacillus sp. Ricciae_BoGa-3 TaxID=3022697 RepID=UPI002340ED92|nr:hypothetical protein [Aneurinibacillus sp. Ricciae_BoGa-3]WCK57297.1 hypothetical protein PP175_29340 [Aneurinibacillus sp. Ricciae_BoGa-3]
MNVMKIVEFEWLKQNNEQLNEADKKRLEELHVFDYIENGEIDMPLTQAVQMMQEVAQIVGKYTISK